MQSRPGVQGAGPIPSVVIPAVAKHPVRNAGIQKLHWMPDQVRHDAQCAAAYAGAVYYLKLFGISILELEI
jgi:hypothetical protein